MNKQRGMTFLGILILVALGVAIVLLGVRLTPSYIEFFSVKKVLNAMANDPALIDMNPKQIRDAFDRRATIDYITSVDGQDLDIGKEDGKPVVSVEYSKRIPLIANVSACLDFSASTAKTADSAQGE